MIKYLLILFALACTKDIPGHSERWKVQHLKTKTPGGFCPAGTPYDTVTLNWNIPNPKVYQADRVHLDSLVGEWYFYTYYIERL